MIRFPYRIGLFVCGLISLVLSRAFTAMPLLIPDSQINWRTYSIALIVVGGPSSGIALLPASWIRRACKIGPDTQGGLSVPVKLLIGFAGFAYLLTVALDFISTSWHPTAQVVYLLCPACVLTITADPSIGSVMLVLAPLNAAVYGSLGAVLGYLLLAIRNRLS